VPIGLVGCLELAQVLERMTLRVPRDVRAAWKAKRPGKLVMSYDQASAIVIEGLRRGTRRHRSIALGVAIQFEFTLRQIDVIGEWKRVDRVKELPWDAIISYRQVWRAGLRFEDFAGGELDLETSKTQTKAIFDVTAYPQALSAVPDSDRNGPLVTDEDGVPLRRRYYQEPTARSPTRQRCPVRFGICLHGIAAAQQAGVNLADIAEHADINTTRKHSIVPSVETSRRVAKQRVAHRQVKKNTLRNWHFGQVSDRRP
jgi:hypothetical protein